MMDIHKASSLRATWYVAFFHRKKPCNKDVIEQWCCSLRWACIWIWKSVKSATLRSVPICWEDNYVTGWMLSWIFMQKIQYVNYSLIPAIIKFYLLYSRTCQESTRFRLKGGCNLHRMLLNSCSCMGPTAKQCLVYKQYKVKFFRSSIYLELNARLACIPVSMDLQHMQTQVCKKKVIWNLC